MLTIKKILKGLLPSSLLTFYHLTRAMLACLTFGFPAKKLRVYGVTGTNGKTTTCFLLYSILKAARHKTGLATTIRFDDGNGLYRNQQKMTTLDPFKLQLLFKRMTNNEVTDAVIEVTSHALHQNRVWGINFDTTIFTNFTHDHLDYHKNKEEYLKAKGLLFAKAHRVSVINNDDLAAKSFWQFKAIRKIIYYLDSEKSLLTENLGGRVWATQVKSSKEGTSFILHLGDQQLPILLKLKGEFNVQNALAAAAAAWGSNISPEAIKEGLASVINIPGRFESLNCGQTFRIILDYAHTPDALKKTLEIARQELKGRLIYVGGATGNRDQTKRPLLGALAGQYADVVLITNEDPDNEDPWKIIETVASGVPKGGGRNRHFILGKNFFKILDRSQAINRALEMANPNDLVMIAGKGDETSMVINGKLIPYSDREVVENFFADNKRPNKFEEEFLT